MSFRFPTKCPSLCLLAPSTLEPPYTRAWGPLTCGIQICDWLRTQRRSKFTVTLDFGGTWGTKDIWVDGNLYDVLHGNKWITFHGLLDIPLGPSRRDRSNTKLWDVAINGMAMVGTCTQTFVAISHGTTFGWISWSCALGMRGRHVGVIWFIFRVLQLLPRRYTQQNMRCISIFTTKHQQQKLEWKSALGPDVVMVIGSVCLLIPWLNARVFLVVFRIYFYTTHPICVHYWVWNNQ